MSSIKKHVSLRKDTIRPALDELGLYSFQAEELLILTAAAETLLGELGRIQIGGGPALSIYQIEPATAEDCWKVCIRKSKKWKGKLGQDPDLDRLVEDDIYATKVARMIYYYKTSKAIPVHGWPLELAKYWKKYWNSELGAGTVEGAISKYEQCLKK